MKPNITCEHRVQEGGMCEDCNKALNENPMGFELALALLKYGVKVTRLAWEDGYIELYQDRIRFCTQEFKTEAFYWASGDDEDLLADDWMIVE